eukprot:TRINITY_DN39209_c0_g1_i1.p1 TRINITY_DN39209_c0_g1~~TRINITY_DN39209_c0_g1_i1.p1  ORF type:complete len:314 (+),score=47.71 TRINITY_DN39209_c0_g1_i1:44-985(+)
MAAEDGNLAAHQETCTAVDAILTCPEGSRLFVPGGAQNVLRAWYGDPTRPWQEGKGCGIALTDLVVRRLEHSDGSIEASNGCLGCDPAHGTFKHLLVEVRDPKSGTGRIKEVGGPRIFDSPHQVSSGPRWVAFVRHAQAGHNVDRKLLRTPDNPLTEEGLTQARDASKGPAGDAMRGAELIITSPLMRAMQTTDLLLGGAAGADGERIRVDAAGTERWSAPCDEGTSKSELLEVVPKHFLDWEGWDVLPERWWAESGEDTYVRAQAFVDMIRRQPEDRIVCVGHGGFWAALLGGRHLGNCEVVFCDRFLEEQS